MPSNQNRTYAEIVAAGSETVAKELLTNEELTIEENFPTLPGEILNSH